MDDRYTDASADVVLQSKDQRTFRVQSYILKANSVLFRSMLETCVSAQSDKAIMIEYPSSAVTDFLDLMHSGTIHGGWTWARCESLLSMIEIYDAPKLQPLVLFRLFDIVSEAPWEILAAASQADCVTLAKLAIAKLPSDLKKNNLQVTNIGIQSASSVRLDYVLGFLGASDGRLNGNYRSSQPWDSIAASFTPRLTR